MRRYEGEELAPGSRIAVVANDALGNYVVSTPLLRLLRETHRPSVLHYFSGTRTEELWAEDDAIDWGYALHGSSPHHSVLHTLLENESEPYDLVINLENSPWAKCFAAVVSGAATYICGPALGADGRGELPFEPNDRGRLWNDKEWIAADLPLRYPFLNSGFIAEIFCRLAYLPGEVPGYRVPSRDPSGEIPDVLVATAASLPEKLWPPEKWANMLQRLKSAGLSVGLLGAKPTAQSRFWEGAAAEEALVERRLVRDLRGRYSLPEVVGALSRARAVLTLDNGILHLAVAAGTPTVGLYRYGIHRLWAPPDERLTVLTPGDEGAVADIEPDHVWEALERAL